MAKSDDEKSARVARLRAMGISFPAVQQVHRPAGIRIVQLGGMRDNRMFGVGSVETAITAHVRMSCESRVHVVEFRIQAPWDCSEFFLLEDPTFWNRKSYVLSGKKNEYARNTVLNHRTGWWPAGKVQEGLIVAETSGPIPSQFTRGIVELELVVELMDGQYKQTLPFLTDGVIDFLGRSKSAPKSNREPLFGADWRSKPDPGVKN